jgi:hypothetical protein
MEDSTIKAAKITAIGAVIAALIGALMTGTCAYLSKPSEKPAENNQGNLSSADPRPSVANPVNSPVRAAQPNSSPPAKKYEAVAEVGEQKTYIDPEIGFVFAAEEITNFLGTSGVLCNYTLPDGKYFETYRRPVGYREDFQYQDRKFFMVIEDIDYDRKVAKIRIKEM